MTSFWPQPPKWPMGLWSLMAYPFWAQTIHFWNERLGVAKGWEIWKENLQLLIRMGLVLMSAPQSLARRRPRRWSSPGHHLVIPWWSSPPFTDHLFKPCSTALSDVGHHLDPGQPLLPALSTVQTQASNTLPGERWSSPPGIQSAILRSGCPVAITHPTVPATNQAGCTAWINTRWSRDES